jgi:dihydrofolate reductase (trimethoprim resistance protein)
MKLSLIAAVSRNSVIGNGPDIPWQAKGEQLLFKALTYGHWLIIGRKTFESMGELPNRKYAVITSNAVDSHKEHIKYFRSTNDAITFLESVTDHAFVAGGGKIYKAMINQVDTLHISEIQIEPEGDVLFPEIPSDFEIIFSQSFESNLRYDYRIWAKKKKGNQAGTE